jgi:hypothetical protein
MAEQRPPNPRLEVHLLFPPDTALATVLAAAGLRPGGRAGEAEVWVTTAGTDRSETR